jgi:hypothetical protein
MGDHVEDEETYGFSRLSLSPSFLLPFDPKIHVSPSLGRLEYLETDEIATAYERVDFLTASDNMNRVDIHIAARNLKSDGNDLVKVNQRPILALSSQSRLRDVHSDDRESFY